MSTRKRLEKLLDNPNVKKMLDVIAQAEGVKHGYNTGFGNSVIRDLSKHPNVSKEFTQTDGKKNTTTAAGRYQFINETWNGAANKLGLKDFSPHSQDLAALYLIQRRGALGDVVKGDLLGAVGKLGKEWASLPSSTYKQNKRSNAEIEKFIGGDGANRVGRGVRAPNRQASQQRIENLKSLYDKSVSSQKIQPVNPEQRQQKIDRLLSLYDDQKNEAQVAQGGLPDFDQSGTITYDQAPSKPRPQEQSLGQNILGAGETALSVGTGALGGLVGATAGTFHGVAKSLVNGEFGTQQGAQNVANTASNVAQALTYQPRTQAGQQQTQALGEFAEDTGLSSLPPTLGGGLGTATATLGRASLPQATLTANNIAQSAKPVIAQAVEASKVPVNAVRSGVNRVTETLGIGGNQAPDTSSAPLNMGAAQVDQATLRQALAEDLPVPMGNLMTEGQLSRNPSQLKFEVETAKQEVGDPLRRRYEEQHEAMNLNLEQFNEMTGAELGNRRDVGLAADKALRAEMEKDRIRVENAYGLAEKSQEAKTPVDLTNRIDFSNDRVGGVTSDTDIATTTLIDYLNNQVPSVTEPILDSAKLLAVKHGLAIKGGDELTPAVPTIKQMESFRKDIVAKTDTLKKPDVRQSTILKKLVDAHTEPYEGKLYKIARSQRIRQAKRWESNSIIKSLMGTKPNSEDRIIALEDVADKIVYNGSLDDMRVAKRLLLTSGDEGRQAWKEVQGSVIQKIKDAATAGIAPDANGKQMISPHALNKAIINLDKSGKLDYLFGKKGAEQLRALNDVSKAMFTVPASAAINHSNTASAIAAMIDATTMLGAGVPVPVASALKIATNHIKDRKIKARVNQALRLDTKSGDI